MCPHPIDHMGIYLLHYAHGNERTGTYDIVCDIFIAIVQDVGFHVGWEQSYALPSATLNSSHQQVNIVVTKDGIHTLTNVVIINPTRVDLFPWSYTTPGFTTSNASQAKEKNYHDQHHTNQFLPLAIEVFGCLLKP
jgi:hypothetical protein